MQRNEADSTAGAVAYLEEDYDYRDRRYSGWSPHSLPGGGRDFLSLKEDGFAHCADGIVCARHAGEAVIFSDAPKYDRYGFGHYRDEYGAVRAKYNIPLIEDHWKAPCP